MRKLKMLACMTLFVFLIGIATNVKAESINYGISANTKTLKEGQTVTITLKVSDINMGADGINTFGGKLVYDENIFEKVKASDFTAKNNWSIAYNDENTSKKGTFLATIMTGTTKDQVIGTVKLKVKTKLKSTKTKVQFVEVSSVGEDTVNLANKSIEFSVTGTVKATTNKDNNNTNTSTNKKPSGSQNKISNTNKDNTTSTGKMPQTGIESTAIMITTLALVLVAVVAYAKFKKSKDIK